MFDLMIIGGGPAGYVAAERAGHKGLKVLLFEKKAMGGVCLNEGCIPTKTMLYSAKTYENALHGDKYGVFADNVRFDYSISMDFQKMPFRLRPSNRKLYIGHFQIPILVLHILSTRYRYPAFFPAKLHKTFVLPFYLLR
jgi:dihydrolipoamide dehydrogenase